MNSKAFSAYRKYMLFFICASIVAIILIAGLRPFQFHISNRVQWLEGRDGIRFRYFGISYSRDLIDFQRKAFSIEILVEPLRERTRGVDHIFQIDDWRESEAFVIGQWNSYLILRGRKDEPGNKEDYFEIGLKDVFKEGVPSYLAITAGEEGVSVYSSGKLINSSPEHSFSGVSKEIKGHLILGNSATGNRGWSGNILRISITERELSEEEIQEHYEDWTRGISIGHKLVSDGVYEYLFKERQGNTIKNKHNEEGRLLIPDKFKVLRKRILVLPWVEFHLNRKYFLDVFINILGFIPLGFFLTLFLSSVLDLENKSAYIWTIAIGVTLSLAIEITQVFMPSRDSSTGDLILNSLGTVIGAFLFFSLYRRFFSEN